MSGGNKTGPTGIKEPGTAPAVLSADGRYRLERPVGKAWLAVHAATGSRVVLKPRASFEDPRVAPHLMRLRHPSLPRILDEIRTGSPDMAGDTDDDTDDGKDESFFVCEYLEGMTFSEWLQRAGGRLTPEEVVAPLARAARVLSFLHEQNEPALLHLDLKPEHFVRLPGGQVGLIDFDCARILPLEPVPRASIRCTAGYAAPELMTGQPGPECDIYSFGVTMLVLLTGFRASDQALPPLEPLCRHLPPALTSIMADCLNTSPERRFQSAAALACALERLSAQPGLLRQTASMAGSGPAPNRIGEPAPVCGADATPAQAGSEADGFAAAVASNAGKDTVAVPASGGHWAARPTACPHQLVAVWDNAAFAVEFACRLTKAGHETIIIDADLLNPRMDLLLAVDPAASSGPADDSGQTVHPGLELALTSLMRQTLLPEHFPTLLQDTGLAGMKALTGAYQLRDYAFHDARTLLQLYRLCRMHADVVVVSCSRFLHDSFSCLSLLAADLILVPVRAELPEIREFNRYLDFLVAQYPFDRRKVRFVAIEYDPALHLAWGMADTLCGGLLAGCIPAKATQWPPPADRTAKRHRPVGGMADELEQLLRRLGFITQPPAPARQWKPAIRRDAAPGGAIGRNSAS